MSQVGPRISRMKVGKILIAPGLLLSMCQEGTTLPRDGVRFARVLKGVPEDAKFHHLSFHTPTTIEVHFTSEKVEEDGQVFEVKFQNVYS